MIYRFEKIEQQNGMTTSSETWGRFEASNISEAIGMFKYAFMARAEEIQKSLWRITKLSGEGWIRRIK